MKIMYPPLLSSNMSAVSQKLSQSLKKETWYSIFSLQRNTTFWAGSKFYFEMTQPWGREVTNRPLKGPFLPFKKRLKWSNITKLWLLWVFFGTGNPSYMKKFATKTLTLNNFFSLVTNRLLKGPFLTFFTKMVNNYQSSS